MKPHVMETGYAVTAALLLCVGCGGGDSSPTGAKESATGAQAGPPSFEVFPPAIWSGFDGVNAYKAPAVALTNSGKVTWTIDDPTLATLTPSTSADGVEQLMITSSKAGTSMIHATDGTHTSSAALEIYAYTPALHDAGKARYMKGPDEMNPACIDCHGKGKGPDHTPTEVDADPDPQIQNTFLTGTDPEGREVDSAHEYANLLKGRKHKWSVTMDEAVGVVAYLRSLEPTGYPEWDAPTTEKEN